MKVKWHRQARLDLRQVRAYSAEGTRKLRPKTERRYESIAVGLSEPV